MFPILLTKRKHNYWLVLSCHQTEFSYLIGINRPPVNGVDNRKECYRTRSCQNVIYKMRQVVTEVASPKDHCKT